MEYICVKATEDSNNFACFSNMSLYGCLIPGQECSSFEENTKRVLDSAKMYKSKGYTVSITRYPLSSCEIKMLRDCGAI